MKKEEILKRFIGGEFMSLTLKRRAAIKGNNRDVWQGKEK